MTHKAIFLSCAALLGGSLLFSLSAADKLNLRARMLLERHQSALREAGASATEMIPAEPVQILVCLADGYSADDIDIPSFTPTLCIGEVVAATINVADLALLDAAEAVAHVELDIPAEPDLLHATAGRQSGVEYAWQGFDGVSEALPQGFSGKGVICAIYDKGIDPNHITFMERDDYSSTRVKGLYHFSGWDGTCSEKDPHAFTTDTKDETHGTHVLGILAGAYNGPGTYSDWTFPEGLQQTRCTNLSTYSDGELHGYKNAAHIPFSGVAYGADILVGCGGYYQTNMLAMAKIARDYAVEHNMPAVLNFSIGNQMGAKDGSSAFNKAMEEIGKDIIVCISASNTGHKRSWIAQTFNGSNSSFRSLLVPPSQTSAVSADVEIWSDTDRPFTFRLFTYDAKTGARSDLAEISEENPSGVTITAATLGEGFSGSLTISSAIQSQNGRYLLGISSSSFKATSPSRNIGIEVAGDDGQRVDAQGNPSYWRFEDLGIDGFTKGSAVNSVNDFATGKNVICVGNYTSRQVWGRLYNLHTSSSGYASAGLSSRDVEKGDTASVIPQDIHPTSAYGTLIDGRTLPHVAAPGSFVVSAYSRYYSFEDYMASAVAYYDGKEYYWHNMNGTSQSAPFFAGVCALWLEANPYLKYDDIMEILNNGGTYQDEFTKEKPERFGFGKVDAFNGLKYAIVKKNGIRTIEDRQPLFFISQSPEGIEIENATGGHFSATLLTAAGSAVASLSGDEAITIPSAGLPCGIYLLSVGTPGCHITKKIIL